MEFGDLLLLHHPISTNEECGHNGRLGASKRHGKLLLWLEISHALSIGQGDGK
jgi:hypothetical protein